jgi:hypothetical protein
MMTLDEKIRLVALYGDISDFNRDRWFKFESMDYTKGTRNLVDQIAGIIGVDDQGRMLRSKQGDEDAKRTLLGLVRRRAAQKSRRKG